MVRNVSEAAQRWPMLVRILIGVSVSCFTAVPVLLLYSWYGGTAVNPDAPFEWSADNDLLLVFDNPSPDLEGCTITPESGGEDYIEMPYSNILALSDVALEPWFSGTATISCDDARAFTGIEAGLVEHRTITGFPGLACLIVGGVIMRRQA